MTALERFTRETVEMRKIGGSYLKPIWRYRELGIAQVEFIDGTERVMWAVAYIPAGVCLTSLAFDAIEDCAAAIIEIDALRNNWLDLPELSADEQRAFKLSIIPIMIRHRARRTAISPQVKAALDKWASSGEIRQRLNGYSESEP